MLRAIVLASLFGFATVADEGSAPPTDVEKAQCAPLHDRLAFLARKYNEQDAFVGASPIGNRTVMITANPDGSSWSLLTTNQKGLLCLIDAGQGWKMRPTGRDT